MVESVQAERDQPAVLERDVILASKVKVPHLRPRCLTRTRLLDALDEAMNRELAVVCTPAGFGKTTLLADWAQGADLPVAWLSLDEDDNDPTRFWRHVLVALDRAGMQAGERTVSLLAEPSGASSEGMAAALTRDLEDLEDDIAVVLDDYHAVETPDVHEGMSYLLGHQPPHLHVVISTRVDPPLPIAKLRASHQLAELRAADLRFTSDESRAFLEEVWDLDVRPETAATLQDRTEGWVVGLQLAALSLKDHPDREAFMEAFAGTHRYVLDYLSEEVFEAQPEPVRSFLLQTAILERICGPLCDAVTGRTDGQEMLEKLDRANLFVVPLDDERRWYRFHQLFCDLLCARLQQTDPEAPPDLHRRAGAWFAEHGLRDEAIRHALEAGEQTWAAELVEGGLNEAFNRGEGTTVVRWLSMLPDRLVESRPRLGIARAMMEWHAYRLYEMDQTLEQVEAALEDMADVGDEEVPTEGGMVSDTTAAISLLRAQSLLTSGESGAARKHVDVARGHITDEESGPRFWAEWLNGAADWIDGRMQEAEATLARMLAEGRATPDAQPLMITCTPLGLVRETMGNLGAALSTYEESLRFANRAARFSPFHVGEAHLGIARVLYQRNDLESALQHATEGVELARQDVKAFIGIGLQTLAWILHARSDSDGARKVMEDSVHLLPRPNVSSWWYPGHAGRAKLQIAQGKAGKAEQWIKEQRLGTADDVSYNREKDYLVLARVLLAKGDAAQALELLGRLDDLAESQGRYGSLVEIRVLRTLALEGRGDHDGALDLLTDTITRATPQGYVRVFVDEGKTMAGLLRRLAGSGSDLSRAARAQLNRVLRAFEPIEGIAGEATSAHLLNPLTDREFEVLQLIAAGKRNQEIATEIYVTVDTVKKHVTHILDKLAVTNRTEAVAEAMNLGIMSRSE